MANLEEILHQHLQKNGYERIAYYQGTKGIYCYDQKSFDLSFSNQNHEEKKSIRKSTNNVVLDGVLGKRIARKNIPSEAKFDTTKQLTKKMQDADIVSHFDFLISDNEIKTAIIFSDFNDFILHTEQSVVRNLSAKIGDWDGLTSLNHNILIFIIPSGISLSQIKETTSRYDHWQNLTSKMFKSTSSDDCTSTDRMIMMDNPYKDEIKNLVNYWRLKSGMQVDWLNFDENIEELVKISKENNIFLKELSAELQRIDTFNKEELYRQFNIKDDKKGLKKLQELKGLEYLADEIIKLVKYANSKKLIVSEPKSDEVKRILPQTKQHKNEVNLHISLTGNPGTGKSTVAKIIAEVFKENSILEIGHCIKVTRDDLVGEYIGHTAIKTKEKINQAMGGVLFIDEAYSLSKGGKNDFGQEAISTILEAMTDREGEFSVVIAGYPNEIKDFLASNPGLPRRFANKIHLKDYEPEILIEIFNSKMSRDGYMFNQELADIFPNFVQNWFDARDEKFFGNAGDVLNLFNMMAQNANYDDRRELCFADIPKAFKTYLKMQSDDVMADALAKLDDIVGLESVKENIKRIIASIKISKLRGGENQVLAGHYIFKGNPGTGKTTVARIFGEILRELKVLKKGQFEEATREDLVQGYVGQTAIKTKEKLEASMGGVLFIDEAYSLSEGGDNDFGKEAITTIVPFMENNIANFTLIVAGYSEDMDKFLDANTGLKSRFTNTIIFEDYTNQEMLSIFKTFTKKDGYSLGDGVEEKLINIFQNIRENSKHFGNGREARKVFNTAKSNLDMRLSTISDLAHGDKRLHFIEIEDLAWC